MQRRPAIWSGAQEVTSASKHWKYCHLQLVSGVSPVLLVLGCPYLKVIDLRYVKTSTGQDRLRFLPLKLLTSNSWEENYAKLISFIQLYLCLRAHWLSYKESYYAVLTFYASSYLWSSQILGSSYEKPSSWRPQGWVCSPFEVDFYRIAVICRAYWKYCLNLFTDW